MKSEPSFLVNEIYSCLQGEGPNLGKPSILIRLQVCNLRCVWCDTPYTHTLKSDPKDPNSPNSGQNFSRMSLEELTRIIKTFAPIRHVIISGGEPTLQNLAPLLDTLSPTYSIEIESNGTQIPHVNYHSFEIPHYQKAQWNISPKGKNAEQKIDDSALSHWSELAIIHPKLYFKFVIRKLAASDDVNEVESLISKYHLPAERIILMAEGTNQECQLNNQWLESICLSNNWQMSPRLHVLTHGERRGV